MDFDPSLYTHAPVVTLQTGVTLCEALAHACPKDADPRTKAAAKKLLVEAKASSAALAERQRILGVATESDSAAIDHEADDVWGGMRARIQGYAALPAKKFPKAKEAAALDKALFGSDGLVFLKGKYPEQRTVMATLLARVENEKLAHAVETFAGKEFLAAARDVQPRYDAMVEGMLRKQDGTATPNLLVRTRAMQAAIVSYATKICAAVDEGDPKSIEDAEKALAPIRNHRENHPQASSDQHAAGSATPPAPVQPV